MWQIVVLGHPSIPLAYPRKGLEPDALSRLADLAGMDVAGLRATTEFHNLLDSHPARIASLGELPTRQARISADLWRPYLRGRHTLLVGSNVARSFGLVGWPWLRWQDLMGGRILLVPSLSHQCKWWTREREAEASRILKELYGLLSRKSEWKMVYG